MDALRPVIPFPRDGVYTRTFEAEIDVRTTTEILVRGRMADHRFSAEHTWVLRTPEYEVVEARARHLEGEPEVLSEELPRLYPAIRGVRIGRGFSNRIRHALGDRPGQTEHLWLAVDMARVGQQVYQFPPDTDDRFADLAPDLPPGPSREARLCWEKDRAWMPDLRNSCHTYSDSSAALFAEREVRCTFGGSVTAPKPGAQKVFVRRKRLTIAPKEGAGPYRCEHRMEDTIHDIHIAFLLGADGTITGAESLGRRLPYAGICEDAQTRTAGLNGRRADGEFIRLLADHVGGSSGCTHLFDLSVDCLRLFAYPS